MPVTLPRQYADLTKFLGSAEAMRRFMNLWPPFLFAHIHIDEMSADFRRVRVTLHKRTVSSNYVGTLYGGSLFSMCDPFWMIMVLRNLGDDYVVWDKAGEIEFVSPGRKSVSTEFVLTDEALDELRAEVEIEGKALRWFENEVRDVDGTLVARVRKQVYVRRPRSVG